MDDQATIVYLNDTIDRLLKEKAELKEKLESTEELIDFYIKHYEKLGKRGTARKFKDLKVDIENAVEFGEEWLNVADD